MWTSYHAGVSGTIMVLAPQTVVGQSVALAVTFLMHFPMDYIGERDYRSLGQTALFEFGLLGIYLASAFLSNYEYPWWLVAAWIVGNLPDAIDKFIMVPLGRPQWFSCHNGPGLFKIGKFKLGYPAYFQLTYFQTVVFNVASTLIFIVLIFALHG